MGSTLIGVSSGTGEVGLGFETGSELERILENDITPAARLGVCVGENVSRDIKVVALAPDLTPAAVATLDEGAGDSFRPKAGSVTDDPFVAAPGPGVCLILGDANLGGRADGLIGPAAAAECERETGLCGGNAEVAGDV
jgi:hypothetical protein